MRVNSSPATVAGPQSRVDVEKPSQDEAESHSTSQSCVHRTPRCARHGTSIKGQCSR